MSCSARLPVYALFVGIFFKENQSLVVLSLYVLGIIMAFLVSTVLTKTILKMIMQSLLWNCQHTVCLPLKRCGVVLGKRLRALFVKQVHLFWRLSSHLAIKLCRTTWYQCEYQSKFLHMVGSFFGMLVQPLGFGTWQAGATLVPGFLAKEVIVSSMAIIYSSGDAGLVNVIQNQFTPLSAYAFMIFILLYIPCVSTVAAIRKETYSWKWTALAVVYPLVTAYVLTFILSNRTFICLRSG